MKKEIENIFSGKPLEKRESCPNQNCPVIIDTREKQSLIAANLLEKKANLRFETLEIGDYIVGESVIERKTLNDFVASMIDKRLHEQLVNLKKYPKPLLILEGDTIYSNISKDAVKSMVLSVALDFQIPIIRTLDEKETSQILILLAKRYENKKGPISLRQSKTLKTPTEQKQFILEGFPGIGPATAKSLIERFKTLNGIFSAKEDELKETGMNPLKIKNFKDLLKN